MKKYKINRTGKENIPSDETIEKFKNFSKLQVRYDEVVKNQPLETSVHLPFRNAVLLW